MSSCLTPVNQSLPLSGPSSLFPGSPVGTHGQMLGLKIDVRDKWSSEVTWIQSGGDGTQREKSTTRTRQEEGVVLVSGRVLLGLEQGVKVPERALYEVVGRHLCEATQSSGFILCVFWLCVCKMVCFTVIVTATHPISRKICLNCVRTFISGCRWPQSGATPRASKLYGLNFFSFQLPLKHNTSCYEKKSRKKERTDCTLFCCFHKLQQPSIQSAGFPLLGNNNFT